MTRQTLVLLAWLLTLAACSGSTGPGQGEGPFPLCIEGWWHGYPAPCSTVAPQCQQATGATAAQCNQPDCEVLSFIGYTNAEPDGGGGDAGIGWQTFAGGTALWSAKARTFMPDGVEQGSWEAANGQVTTVDTTGLEATVPASCAPGQLTLTNTAGTAAQFSSFDDAALVAALNAHGALGSWNTITY